MKTTIGKFCAVAATGIFALSAKAETIDGKPDAYLDYIEATGTQYIDTGVQAETGLKARIDVQWTVASGDMGFLGARENASTESRFFLYHGNYNSSKFQASFGYGAFGRTGIGVGTSRHEIVSDFTDNSEIQIYVNGSKTLTAENQATRAGYGPIALTRNLYLFAVNIGGTPNYYGKCKLYELKIFRKNAQPGKLDLIRHYLPCKKNDRAALYDKVEGKIYFSDSGTDLSAGTELPTPREFVEWIESDANTKDSEGTVVVQYIDTRVIGKSGIRSAVDVMLRNDYSGDHGILACRKDQTDSRFYLAYFYQSVFRYAYMGLPTTNEIVKVSSTKTNGRYFIESDFSLTNQSVKVNGTELHKVGVAHSNEYFNTGTHLSLFGTREGNGIKTRTLMRLYSCRIWDGDELLRDFAPCVASNGRAGLYDSVTRRVFTNGSPYDFDPVSDVGGCTNIPEIAEGALPQYKIDYIESDGTNVYFDLGITAKDGVEMEAEMEWVTVPGDNTFVGAYDGLTGNKHRRFYLLQYSSSRKYHLGYSDDLGSANTGTAVAATPGVKYYVTTRLDGDRSQFISVKHKDGNGSWVWDSNVDGRNTTFPGPFTSDRSIYLFARNNQGVADLFSQARVYKLKLREKQGDGSYKLVRDFVPVKYGGVVMLWDKVSETFFRNKGHGSVTGGDHERKFFVGTQVIIR